MNSDTEGHKMRSQLCLEYLENRLGELLVTWSENKENFMQVLIFQYSVKYVSDTTLPPINSQTAQINLSSKHFYLSNSLLSMK